MCQKDERDRVGLLSRATSSVSAMSACAVTTTRSSVVTWSPEICTHENTGPQIGM